MRELVTLEKSTYNRLLNIEAASKDLEKEIKEGRDKYAELERRYYALLTAERDQQTITNWNERMGKLGGEINAAIVEFHQ